MTSFSKLIAALTDSRVRFVLIGGVALIARGGARVTNDLDLVYDRATDNLENLVSALGPLHPRLRGAPPDLPFLFDTRTLRSGLNFTLISDAGEIDLFGEVAGLGGHREALSVSTALSLFGRDVRVLDLDGLESTKRAAGRAKDLIDLETIAALKKAR